MPRLLPDYDIQIIHAIKNANKAWNFAIPEAVSKLTGSRAEIYNESILNDCMTDVFCDYVAVCDNPAGAVRNLFRVMRDGRSGTSLWYSIAMVLDQVQVKKKNPDGSYQYINGFWEIPEDKKLTKEEEDEYQKIVFRLLDKVGTGNASFVQWCILKIDIDTWKFPDKLRKSITNPQLQNVMNCIEEDKDLKEFAQTLQSKL